MILFEQTATAHLDLEVRGLGLITLEQADRAVVSGLSQVRSLLVWPQLVGLMAATVVLFAIAYIAYMLQEVRT